MASVGYKVESNEIHPLQWHSQKTKVLLNIRKKLHGIDVYYPLSP